MAKTKNQPTQPAPAAPAKPAAPVSRGKRVNRTTTVVVAADAKAVPQVDIFDVGELDEPAAPVATPAAATAPTTPAAEEKKPEPITHPAYLRQMAEEYGYTAEELAAKPTAELEREVAAIHRREQQRQAAIQHAAQTPASQQPTTPAAPASQARPGDDEIDWGVDEAGRPYTADDFSPGIVRQIREQHKKIKDLEARIGGVQQTAAQKAGEDFERQLDAEFEKHQDVYGKGRTRDLLPSSPEFQRRLATYQHLQGLGARKALTKLDQDVGNFRAAMFGAVKTAAAAAAPAGNGRPTAEQWGQGGLVKPTARNSVPEPKGKERAAKVVAKKLAELGDEPGASADDEIDALDI